MAKRCAKCEKTVYPAEELKCLDKVRERSAFYFNGRSPRCLSLMCLLYIANFHRFTAVNIVVN